MTNPASMANMPPVHIVGISKTFKKIDAVAFACTILPAPNAARKVHTANTDPNHGSPAPLAI